jgi:hypothetical protein
MSEDWCGHDNRSLNSGPLNSVTCDVWDECLLTLLRIWPHIAVSTDHHCPTRTWALYVVLPHAGNYPI